MVISFILSCCSQLSSFPSLFCYYSPCSLLLRLTNSRLLPCSLFFLLSSVISSCFFLIIPILFLSLSIYLYHDFLSLLLLSRLSFSFFLSHFFLYFFLSLLFSSSLPFLAPSSFWLSSSLLHIALFLYLNLSLIASSSNVPTLYADVFLPYSSCLLLSVRPCSIAIFYAYYCASLLFSPFLLLALLFLYILLMLSSFLPYRLSPSPSFLSSPRFLSPLSSYHLLYLFSCSYFFIFSYFRPFLYTPLSSLFASLSTLIHVFCPYFLICLLSCLSCFLLHLFLICFVIIYIYFFFLLVWSPIVFYFMCS